MEDRLIESGEYSSSSVPRTTGELRSALQPVVFLHLLKPVKEAGTGNEVFGPGVMVASQYWGAGLVALTSTYGERHMVVAHDIHAVFASPDAPSAATPASPQQSAAERTHPPCL
jgi:hypothetical protein